MSKEEKAKKFVVLAEKRVTNVINQIRLVGNLSSRNNYDYSTTQVKKVFDAIESELRMAKARFQAGLKKDEEKVFRLNEGDD